MHDGDWCLVGTFSRRFKNSMWHDYGRRFCSFNNGEPAMSTSSRSDIDLLRVLLGVRRAKRLYRGTLAPLFDPKEELSADHARLLAARELVRRWLLEELRQGPHLQSPAQTREYLKLHFAGKEREVFACLFLDNRHRLIAAENLFYGTIDGASVHPREVVKRALQLNAAAVIQPQSSKLGERAESGR
jgi:hypothetical protein